MLVESPGAYLHARRASGTELLRLGATGAACTPARSARPVTCSSLVVLLGLAALELTSVAVAGAAFTAVVLRWGSTSLAAIAGGQAVLGPAVAVGPWAAAVSTAAAAVALLCVAEPGPTAVPFGLAAALLVSWPGGHVAHAVRGSRRRPRPPASWWRCSWLDGVAQPRRRRVGIVAAVLAVAAASGVISTELTAEVNRWWWPATGAAVAAAWVGVALADSARFPPLAAAAAAGTAVLAAAPMLPVAGVPGLTGVGGLLVLPLAVAEAVRGGNAAPLACGPGRDGGPRHLRGRPRPGPVGTAPGNGSGSGRRRRWRHGRLG